MNTDTSNAEQQERVRCSALLGAAENMDWIQVVLNGGPPCCCLERDGRFCGRAERWDGHHEPHRNHAFKTLAELLREVAPNNGAKQLDSTARASDTNR